MIIRENLQNEQSSCSFSRDKQAITSSFYKNTVTTDLKNQTLMLRSVPQMLKKWRIVVNKISKVRQNTCNWIKKILDKVTRIVIVFLISWFFYLFLLCSILSLLVTNRIPAKFAREAPTKSAVLYRSFFSETGLENSREIGGFFREFAPANPAKFSFFFPRSTRSPDPCTAQCYMYKFICKYTLPFIMHLDW